MKTFLAVEAAGSLVLALFNALFFVRFLGRGSKPARRAAAATLFSLNAGLALEALLYLSLARQVMTPEVQLPMAQLIVRSLLLLTLALLFVLIARGASLRR